MNLQLTFGYCMTTQTLNIALCKQDRTSKFIELWSPLGNKFDLEVGQRSRSRSRHGFIGKVLSQRTHMPSIKVLPVIVQKLWPRLKFL